MNQSLSTAPVQVVYAAKADEAESATAVMASGIAFFQQAFRGVGEADFFFMIIRPFRSGEGLGLNLRVKSRL
jgi:hypothetical protein